MRKPIAECSSLGRPRSGGHDDLPREAVLGYRDTLYPEYRKKIKDTYVPPPPCKADCGVAGNFVRQRGP